MIAVLNSLFCNEYKDTCNSILVFNNRFRDFQKTLHCPVKMIPLMGSLSLLLNCFHLVMHAKKINYLIVENDRQLRKYKRLLLNSEKCFEKTAKKLRDRIAFFCACKVGIFLYSFLRRNNQSNGIHAILMSSDIGLSCFLYILIKKMDTQMKTVISAPIAKYISAPVLLDVQD